MKNYMAPMEGVTNWVYRNAYNECFYPMDKYFTPFITAKPNKRLSSKEIKEVSPDTNGKLPVVPQILTNNAEDFVKTAHIFRDEYGHKEVNLNLGCPSGTVTAKEKGPDFWENRKSLTVFWTRSLLTQGWRFPLRRAWAPITRKTGKDFLKFTANIQ